MKNITVLGSTGSIGESTLNVIQQHPDKYKVIALTANSQVEKIFAQCQRFNPEYVVMASENAAEQLQQKLRANGLSDIKLLYGVAGLEKVASLENVDYVMAAIVGAAGLLPALAAARSGKRVLLANKEALVMSGHLFMEEVKKNNAELLPID
ncbi:MAG: 1-deoxy-D-xylulose-5-phosphate reductoisomerase, partial [Gammaproteobacteria bacterium]|nr:1-deoxy-D-xylulose-5-phosphate reductoisomerase [Gammaproteobacteria bacterium]